MAAGVKILRRPQTLHLSDKLLGFAASITWNA